MSKPIAEIYQEAWNLFQDKTKWAQGFYHFDSDNNKCGIDSAYSYCALGVLYIVNRNESAHNAQCCLQRVSQYLYDGRNIQHVNDDVDDPNAYDKVLDALKFAAELWEGVEPTEEELGMPVPELLEKRKLGKQ